MYQFQTFSNHYKKPTRGQLSNNIMHVSVIQIGEPTSIYILIKI